MITAREHGKLKLVDLIGAVLRKEQPHLTKIEASAKDGTLLLDKDGRALAAVDEDQAIKAERELEAFTALESALLLEDKTILPVAQVFGEPGARFAVGWIRAGGVQVVGEAVENCPLPSLGGRS